MASKKAVLFNLWGVVVSPRPAEAFLKFEETHKLPSGFLEKLVTNENSAMQRAERGKLSLSQMIPELDAECVSAASDQKVSLPAGFSVKSLLEELRDSTTVNKHILQTVATLRSQGLLTGVLANQWVDDSGCGDSSGRLLSLLGGHFDVVLQSCRTGLRVPEADLFISALKQLGVPPKQALWLADDEKGVGAAEALGMTAVLVKDLPEALKQVETFTGVQAVTGESYPASCNPEEVSHGYVTVKPDVKLHYVEMGTGPPVMLCHGFPESWYSWRYQIPALADAGFRVVSLDMKGYGQSTAPPDIEEYSQEQICQDLVTFMDKMGIPQVTLVGHDWGGSVVWNMAQCHPERVRAVASLNTPLFPVDPSKDPMDFLKTVPIFNYQLYFQNPGVAEAEMEKDLARTFKIFFHGSGDEDNVPTINTAGVCARGGLFVGLPDEIPRSSILSETALQFYITQFKDKGFRGPLNWYRNVVSNWKWLCSRPRAKLLMPALMVTAGKDPVLLPVFSRGMENMIPNLTRGHIEECGHWTQMERPSELNNILISWLKDTHSNMGVAVTPKL
ncbi:bifunctional epoxide hydrolase 2 [Oncorhynchus clarkii lewisi]|uniref:bifunctional epoxide hydrolase 2 n=1 Tax=Oncorhynchus clarkii lewisi TaxID=490388 RepID=UPI0039B93070